MDVNATIKKVEVSLSHFQQILGCAICIDYLRSPVKTPCNHFFCKSCLDDLFKTSKSPAVCPVCKSPVSKRSVHQCTQVASIANMLLKLNTAFENDLMSLEIRFNKTPEEKISDKSFKWKNTNKTKEDDSNKNIDENVKLENNKDVPRREEASESEFRDSQKENHTENIVKAPRLSKKKTTKTKPASKNEEQRFILDEDAKNTSGTEAELPKQISSNTKVSQWLSDYCETPENEELSFQFEMKSSPKNDKPLVGCTPSEHQQSDISDKIDDNIEVAVILKRNVQILKSRDESKIDSSASTIVLNDDPYSFVSSQENAPAHKKRTRKKGPRRGTKKVQPLHISTVINETVKLAKKNEVIVDTIGIESSADEHDPYALFVDPVAKSNEIQSAQKSTRRTKKTSLNKGLAKTRKQHNSKTENELTLITNSLELADMYELKVEKESQPEFTKQQGTEHSKKRKLTSGTHSFTESQDDCRIASSDNKVNTSSVDPGNRAYPHLSLNNEKMEDDISEIESIKPITRLNKPITILSETSTEKVITDVYPTTSTLTSDKRIFINEVPDEEIVSIDSEKVIKNLRHITEEKSKHHISYFYFGKLSTADNVFFNSVSCQTEEMLAVTDLKMNSNDDYYTVDLAPDNLKCGLAVEDKVPNSEVPAKENVLVDTVGNVEDVDMSIQFPASLMVQTTTEALCTINSEDKSNSTPTKPSKRMKTKSDLVHAADSDSVENKNVTLSLSKQVRTSTSKRLLDFSNEKMRREDQQQLRKLSTKNQKINESKKSYRRIVNINDSDQSDSDQLSTASSENLKNVSTRRRRSCSPKIIQLDTLPDLRSQMLDEFEVRISSTSKGARCGMSMLSDSNKENKEQLQSLSDDSINLINDEFMDDQSGSEMLFEKPEDNVEELDEEINAIFKESQNNNDILNIDNDDKNLLYTSTPVKKQFKLQNLSKTCEIVEEEEIRGIISPFPSTANVTTQAFLKLKANIEDLERKKRLMEMELEAAERENGTKLEKGPLMSFQPKVTTDADQCMMEVSSIFNKGAATSKTTGSKAVPKMKLLNSTLENTKLSDVEEDTTVSPSPQAKIKWTPNRVGKKFENAAQKSPYATIKTSLTTTFTNARVNSPTAIVRQRSLPKSYAFVTSGVNVHQLKQVKQLVQLLKGSFSPSFIPKVTTHVIVNTGKDRLAERTLKYLTGISEKCWIISFDWVVESLKAGYVLPEGDYEALGDNNDGAHGGPTKARLNPTPLLKDFQVLIMEPFKDLTKDQVVSLLINCGAKIITHPSLFNGTETKQLILTDKNPNDAVIQQYSELHNSYGLSTVNRDWLLDSVASYTVKPVHNYILSTLDFPSSPSLQ